MNIKLSIYLFFISLLMSHTSHAQTVTLFAAASLTQPINQIIKNYENDTGLKISPVYAASSTLARQINHGAPADIYMSANLQWMDYLNKNNKIDSGSLTTLLSNQLVLVAPISSKIDALELTNPNELTHLLKTGKLAMGNADHVPVGLYAKQALINLALWDKLKGKLAFSANTRGALAFAERAAVPAAIVYLTDAKASTKVKTLAVFPTTSHDKIEYPLALTNNSPTSATTLQFYHYLKSEKAHNVFKQFSFKVAGPLKN